VDTSEAGDGEITVDVTYDGRQMATRVDRTNQLWQVSFVPEGPGIYTIEVDFANMDVPGKLSSCRQFCVGCNDPYAAIDALLRPLVY